MSMSRINRRRLNSFILFFIVAVVGCLIFAQWSDREKFISAVKTIGITWLCLLLMLSLLNYGLRIARWQSYLRVLGENLPFTLSTLIYVAGFALTMTPGKAGEMYRGVLLKSYEVTYTNSSAAFVSERLSDLFAIVLLTSLGAAYQPHALMIMLVEIIITIVILVLLSHGKVFIQFLNKSAKRPGRLGQAIQHGLTLLMDARRCHTPRILISATLLSLLAWSSEASAFYLILHRLGFNVSLLFSFSVYALATLAGAISFLPGGLGGTEAVLPVCCL